MPFILKGKAMALRSQTISLKHNFVCAARGIYWHLGGVGRTALCKKRKKKSNL